MIGLLKTVETGLLLVVAIVNFLPVMGLQSAGRLKALYGVDLADPNMVVLLRHRALLFGLLGGFMLAAVWHTPWRVPAFVMGAISMVGYLLVVKQAGVVSEPLMKVYRIDVAAIVLLAVAMACFVLRQRMA